MKKELDILALEDKQRLIEQLQEAGYSFAVWQMPNETKYRFIISLRTPVQLDSNLNEVDAGFLVNRFDDNHPAAPFHISADIEISKDSVKINPVISDQQIDEFLEDINSSKEHISKAKTIDNPPNNEFEEQVASAIEHIRNEDFEKVVLSRYKDIPIPHGFKIWIFFKAITKDYPASFCSITFIPNHGLWIGASPELLISESKSSFKTIALAGTKRLMPNQSLSEIAWTQKEIEEQALVSRYIINCFKKIRLREFHEHGPKTVQAGNLVHLKTEFNINYDEVSFDDLGEQMLELLHPTSAVCGMPIENTKPWIKEVEKYDREFYAGFLGPVNIPNEVNLFVNLRCLKIQDGLIRFYAGAGITEDSVPAKEFEETEMKMNVLMSKLDQ